MSLKIKFPSYNREELNTCLRCSFRTQDRKLFDEHCSRCLSAASVPDENLYDEETDIESEGVITENEKESDATTCPPDDASEVPYKKNQNNRNYTCTICGFESKSGRDYLLHERDIHGTAQDIAVCDLCDYASKQKNKINRHRESKHKGAPALLEITIIKSPFPRQTPRQGPVPMSITESDEKSSTSSSKSEPRPKTGITLSSGKKLYMCHREGCSFTAELKAEIMRHRTTHLDKTHRCDKCEYITYNRNNVDRHNVNHGLTEATHKCGICDFGATRSHVIVRHMNDHHLAVPHEDKFVHDLKNNTKRAVPVSGTKSRGNHGDKAMFSDSSSVVSRSSISSYGEETDYICCECGFSSSDKAEYKEHLKEHEDDVANLSANVSVPSSFDCDVCDFKASFEDDLYVHFGLHSDVYVETCMTCRKRFKTQEELLKHEVMCTINLGEDDLAVDYIETMDENDVEDDETEDEKNEDQAVNMGDVLNNCHNCSYIANSKEELENHYTDNHLTERRFQCTRCSNHYRYSSDLKVHVRRAHNDVLVGPGVVITAKASKKRNRMGKSTIMDLFKKQNENPESPKTPSSTSSDMSLEYAQLQKCLYCDYSSMNVKNLALHVDTFHNDKTASDSGGFQTPSKRSCIYCEFDCHSKEGIKFHYEQVHENEWKTEDNLNEILNISNKSLSPPVLEPVYENQKSYSAEYPTLSQAIANNASGSNDKLYSCNSCPFKTLTQRKLSYHISGHEDLRVQKCILCGFRSNFEYQMKRHVRKDHNKRGKIGRFIYYIPFDEARRTIREYIMEHGTESELNAHPPTLERMDMLPMYSSPVFNPGTSVGDDIIWQQQMLQQLPMQLPQQVTPKKNTPTKAAKCSPNSREGYIRPFKCSTCGKRSNWKWDLNKHIKMVHSGIGECIVLSEEEARNTLPLKALDKKRVVLYPTSQKGSPLEGSPPTPVSTPIKSERDDFSDSASVGSGNLGTPTKRKRSGQCYDRDNNRKFMCSICKYRSNYKSDILRHSKSKHADGAENTVIILSDEEASRTVKDYILSTKRLNHLKIPLLKSGESSSMHEMSGASEDVTMISDDDDDNFSGFGNHGDDNTNNRSQAIKVSEDEDTEVSFKMDDSTANEQEDVVRVQDSIGSLQGVDDKDNPVDNDEFLIMQQPSGRGTNSKKSWSKCSKCNFTCFGKSKFRKHMLMHKASNQLRVTCKKCGYNGNNVYYMKTHVENIHNDIMHELIETNNGDRLSFKCKYCSVRFKTVHEATAHTFENHRELMTPKKNAPSSPGRADKSDADIENSGIWKKMWKCSKCQFKTKEYESILIHYKTHCTSNEGPYRCKSCSYSSQIKSALMRHVRCIHGDKDYSLVIEDIEFEFVKKESAASVEIKKLQLEYENTVIKTEPIDDYPTSDVTPAPVETKSFIKPYDQFRSNIDDIIELAVHGKCDTSIIDEKNEDEVKVINNLKNLPANAPDGYRYRCKKCKHSSGWQTAMHRHLKTVHKISKLTRSFMYAVKVNAQSLRRKLTPRKANVVIPTSSSKTKQVNPSWIELKTSRGQLFCCKVCPYRTTKKQQIIIHLKRHIKRAGMNQECELCPYWVDNRASLNKHMHHHKSKPILPTYPDSVPLTDLPDSSDDKNRKYSQVCPYCPFVTKNIVDLNYHKQLHSKRPNANFKCHRCDYWVLNKKLLGKHVRVHEPSYGKRKLIKKINTEINFTYIPSPCKSDLSEHQLDIISIASLKQKIITSKIIESRLEAVPRDDDILMMKDCTKMYKSEGGKDAVNYDDKYTRLFRCKFCPFSCLHRLTMNMHERKHGSAPSNYLGCLHCSFKCRHTNLMEHHLRFHEQNHHLELGSLDKNGEHDVDSKTIPLPYTVDYDETLQDTVIKPSPTPRYCCDRCPFGTTKRNYFEKHMQLHGSKQKYACEFCDYSVPLYSHMMKHRMYHLKPNPNLMAVQTIHNLNKLPEIDADVAIHLSCPKNESEDPIGDYTGIHDHVDLYENRDPGDEPKKLYRCDRCPFANVRRDYLLNHLKFHVIRSLYQCPYCDYSVSKPNVLSRHIKVHFSPLTPDGVNDGGNPNVSEARLNENDADDENIELPIPVDRAAVRPNLTDINDKDIKHFICQYCDRKFQGAHLLVRHEMQHLIGNHF